MSKHHKNNKNNNKNNNNNNNNKKLIVCNKIDELQESKSTILHLSNYIDPYLGLISYANKIGKSQELRSLVEYQMSIWLDKNKTICKTIMDNPIDKTVIINDALSLIYESDVKKITKILNKIRKEIIKYLTPDYFIIMKNINDISVQDKLFHCPIDNKYHEYFMDLKNKNQSLINVDVEDMSIFLDKYLNYSLYERTLECKSNRPIAYGLVSPNNIFKELTDVLIPLFQSLLEILQLDYTNTFIGIDNNTENNKIGQEYDVQFNYIYIYFNKYENDSFTNITLNQPCLQFLTKYKIYLDNADNTFIRLF